MYITMNIIQSSDYTLTYFGGADLSGDHSMIDLPNVVFNNDEIESFGSYEEVEHNTKNKKSPKTLTQKKKRGAAETNEFIKKHWSMFDDLGFKMTKVVEIDTTNQVSTPKIGASEKVLATHSAIMSAAHDEDDDDIVGGVDSFDDDVIVTGSFDDEEFIDDFVKTQVGSYEKIINGGAADGEYDEYDFFVDYEPDKHGGQSDDSDEEYYNFYE